MGSSQARDWTCVSHTGRLILYHWATREAPLIFCLFVFNSVCKIYKRGNSLVVQWLRLSPFIPWTGVPSLVMELHGSMPVWWHSQKKSIQKLQREKNNCVPAIQLKKFKKRKRKEDYTNTLKCSCDFLPSYSLSPTHILCSWIWYFSLLWVYTPGSEILRSQGERIFTGCCQNILQSDCTNFCHHHQGVNITFTIFSCWPWVLETFEFFKSDRCEITSHCGFNMHFPD